MNNKLQNNQIVKSDNAEKVDSTALKHYNGKKGNLAEPASTPGKLWSRPCHVHNLQR